MCSCCRHYHHHHHYNNFPVTSRGTCCSPCSPLTPFPSHSTTPTQHHSSSHCCSGLLLSCGGVRPATSCSSHQHQSRCCSAALVSCNNSGHLLTCSTPIITCNGHTISPCSNGLQCFGGGHNGAAFTGPSHGGHNGTVMYTLHSHCNNSCSNTPTVTHCGSHSNTLCGNLNCTNNKLHGKNSYRSYVPLDSPLLCDCRDSLGGELEPMLSTPGSPPPPTSLDQRSEHKVSLFSII